jgi:hypothetical protein
MLAYVFSHHPATGVNIAEYENALTRFHAALAGAPPTGFISSSTYRVEGGYGDWYLVESSAALDALNSAAISGARSSSHDAAARMSADGSGKLYSLVSGGPPAKPGFEIRFSKPDGMSYGDLNARLKDLTDRPGVSLWRRMMVLGPPPEFCMIAPDQLELPRELKPEVLPRTEI